MESGGDGEQDYKGSGGGDRRGIPIIFKRSAGDDATHCAGLSVGANNKRVR